MKSGSVTSLKLEERKKRIKKSRSGIFMFKISNTHSEWVYGAQQHLAFHITTTALNS